MNRLQRIALSPFVAVIQMVLIAVFIVCCAVALYEWEKGD